MTTMILADRHYVKSNLEIIRLCSLSRELYNRTNFLMRQAWFNQQHLKIRLLPNITQLRNSVKYLDCFKQFGNTKTPMFAIGNSTVLLKISLVEDLAGDFPQILIH